MLQADYISDISIHPPREGWDELGGGEAGADVLISIHPPREGWDQPSRLYFLIITISIHPPREGWDLSLLVFVSSRVYFNPPTP